MNVNPKKLNISKLKPPITVFGVGGAGGYAVNNMIDAGLQGVDFRQHRRSGARHIARPRRTGHPDGYDMRVTGGLAAGSQPDVGRNQRRTIAYFEALLLEDGVRAGVSVEPESVPT